jgi:hypothetical protein
MIELSDLYNNALVVLVCGIFFHDSIWNRLYFLDNHPERCYGTVVSLPFLKINCVCMNANLYILLFSSRSSHYRNVEYYPPKMLACLVPVIIIVVFVFTPFVYTILNRLSMPRSSSTSHLSDEYANCDRYRMQRNLRNSR